jgi:uncharacterized membrane protein
VLRPALGRVPIETVQAVAGVLLLLFGLRWLRKAILRGAGAIPLRDEGVAFAREIMRLRALGAEPGWDTVAFAASFQITMLEGIEVVFIVIAIGAGSHGLLWPASIGALAALLTVAALGLIVHRPLANVPENTLKFAVGVLLSGFGTFWMGEGLGIPWPGSDWAIVMLSLGYLTVALLTMQLARTHLKRVELS